jgi:hypothetical protein
MSLVLRATVKACSKTLGRGLEDWTQWILNHSLAQGYRGRKKYQGVGLRRQHVL